MQSPFWPPPRPSAACQLLPSLVSPCPPSPRGPPARAGPCTRHQSPSLHKPQTAFASSPQCPAHTSRSVSRSQAAAASAARTAACSRPQHVARRAAGRHGNCGHIGNQLRVNLRQPSLPITTIPYIVLGCPPSVNGSVRLGLAFKRKPRLAVHTANRFGLSFAVHRVLRACTNLKY
jgi:hypothetical protein